LLDKSPIAWRESKLEGRMLASPTGFISSPR